jgi:CRISPR system Cascade subunit CasB
MSDEKGINWSRLTAWWESLDDDRGGRAELRRARTAVEAAFCPAFQRLVRDLRVKPEDAQRLALAAALLAWVRTNAEQGEHRPSLPHLMAEPGPGGATGKVSGLRFRRLLQARDQQELFPLLLRVIHLIGDRAPVVALARDVYYWGDHIRENWAYDYYSLAPDRNDPKAA